MYLQMLIARNEKTRDNGGDFLQDFNTRYQTIMET